MSKVTTGTNASSHPQESIAVGKTKALLEKPFDDLPVAKDLPRLAKQILVCDSDGHILRSTEGVQFDMEPAFVHVRDILVTLAKELCGDESSAKIASAFDATMTPVNISLPEVLGKFLRDVVGGDGSPVVAVLKSCNQSAISPAVIELKTALGSENGTKDVSDSWKIIILLRPEDNTIQVTNKKRELDIHEEFQFQWEMDMLYDQSTMRCIDVALHVTDLLFAESIKPSRLKDVIKVLGRFMTTDVAERKTESMFVLKAHIASSRRNASAAAANGRPVRSGSISSGSISPALAVPERSLTPGSGTMLSSSPSPAFSSTFSPTSSSSTPASTPSSASTRSRGQTLVAPKPPGLVSSSGVTQPEPVHSGFSSKQFAKFLPSAIKISTGDIGLMRFPDKIILPRMTLLTGERIMCSLPSVVHESVVGPLLLTNFRVIFFSENSELASRLVPDHNTVAMPIAASSSSQLGGSGSQTAAAAARTAKITSTPTMSTQYAQNIAEKGLQLPILCIESIKRSKNTQQLEVWSREGGVLRFEVLSADRKAAIRSFCAAIFKTIPVEVPRTFAFSHHTSVPHAEDGWRMFTWAKEYCRMAVGEGEGSSWRISDVNNSYDLSRNYPRYLAVPVGITDKEIQGTFSARVEGRGPVLVWRNPHSCQTITRAAHYLDFNIKTRVFDEEKLLSAIISSSKHLGGGKTFLFVDCGSSIAPAQWRSRLRLAYASGPSLAQLTAGESSPSFGNSSPLSLAVEASPSSSGGVGADPTVFSTRDGMDPSPPLDGGEGPPFDFVLLKLDPFPSVKLAHARLLKVLSDQQHLLSDSFIGGAVEQTGWLQLLLNLLRASSQVASSIVHDGASVMVLSEQGLDRSAQLSSLVQMMVDPYYRTIDGFCTLIEKEWLAMGHPFTTRCGHLRVRQEALEGPCFLLFLEAVILLLNFFPTRFEFTSKLVLLIALHLNSGLYGTFLCDDDRRRKELLVRMNTVSLWTRVNVNKPFFVNPFWLREGSIVFSSPLLLPMLYPHNITLWSEYYLRRWDLPHSHFEGQQHEWILAFFSKYLPTLEPPAPDEAENYPPPIIPKRTQ